MSDKEFKTTYQDALDIADILADLTDVIQATDPQADTPDRKHLYNRLRQRLTRFYDKAHQPPKNDN